ncbi:MAG: isoprenylcysteine carboxylmethyltransferase family protein [Hyphomicrobiales bacterium]
MGEGAWLVLFLVTQRLAELAFATHNTLRLIGRGGAEFGQSHYYLIVALHAFWLLALWIMGHDRAADPYLLGVFVLLQVARLWVIASLGARWTTRVIVVPGEKPLARGPYRWIRHPNYLIVVVEIAVVPLALGLWGIAIVFSLANAALLYIRIRVENEALAWAARQPGPTLANANPRR